MNRKCPICGKYVKKDQSASLLPQKKEKGRIKMVKCHLDCVLAADMEELEEIAPYYYEEEEE